MKLNKNLFVLKSTLLSVAFLMSLSLFSQHETKSTRAADANDIIERRVEYLVDNSEESDADYTTIFDQLYYFYNHPLNLNRAKLSDLEDLGLLTDFQINNLLKHIEKDGKLITLEELQTINGFDQATIKLILPFVKVGTDVNTPQLTLHELLNKGENVLFVRYQRILEQKKGFSPITDSALAASPNSRYKGDANKIYTRYRYKYGNHLSIGFTAEKDAGEQFFKGAQKNGFDFYSAHFFLRNQGKIKQLAIGDYQAQFGQGLTYWSGLAFGKSSAIMLVKRSAEGLKPYTSVDENLFLRGGGLTLQFGKIEATAFYSYNKIDGNIILADSSYQSRDILTVSSIQLTGLHRTNSEIEDKDAITQQVMGGHVAYKTRQMDIGITGIRSQINAGYNPRLYPYSQFRSTASQQSKIGADYNILVQNFNFFGEFSQSINAGYAYVSGALVTLDPKISLATFYRDYQRDFQPISSAGIGENSTTEDEKGLYIGIIANPVKKVEFTAYYDQFTFPWLKFGVSSPSKGHQYLTQLTYKPSKKMEMYVRVRERLRDQNTKTALEGIDYLVAERQTNYRFNYSYKISDAIRLKGRVELVNYHLQETPFETGFLIYQDIIYKPMNSKLSFSFRYGIFDTDSYNSRIYAYENDVLYTFSIPAYYDRGTRTYLTLRYKIKRGIDIWLRYALTYYDNINTIGTSLDEIQSNHKSEVKAQIRFKF